MRPIVRSARPEPTALFEADRLMGAIGAYCSLCERPIHDRPTMWDSARDVVVEQVDEVVWNELLMLCVNCADWQQRSAGSTAELLLPHKHLTFRVSDQSPFRYTLEQVTLRIVDDDGSSADADNTSNSSSAGTTNTNNVSTEVTSMAIVSGATPAAQNTIDRFQLNTPYYNAGTKTMTVPRNDHLALVDRRVTLRTDAWLMAARMIPIAVGLRRDAELTPAFLGMRHLAEHTGFWSVWLTQFWRVMPERDTMLTLFAPTRVVAPVASLTQPKGLRSPSPANTLLHGTSTAFLD
jgi:hypothetical protein